MTPRPPELTALANSHLEEASGAAWESSGVEARAIVSALAAIATELAALREACENYPETR